MNILKIKLNPYKDINIVSLDDKPLSPYSELNNFMKEPFLSWASKILDAAEREINDDYSMVVISDLFEKLFLKGMQNDYDACIGYSTDVFQIDMSSTERFELVKKLASKYGISYSLAEFKLPIYTDMGLVFDETFVELADIEFARIVITKDKRLVDQIGNNIKGSIIVYVSGGDVVKYIGDEKYIWEIEENNLDVVVGSIIDRFVKSSFVAKISGLLNEILDDMREEDRQVLAVATEIDPFITIADVPEIEVGNTVSLEADVFPRENEVPKLRIVPQNDTIVNVSGLNIVAVASGTTYIDIYREEENIPFTSKKVTTFRNNHVKKIDLFLQYSKMGIARKQSIDVKFTPADADDINLVKWSVDNSGVLMVSREGKIIALKEGTATITASTIEARSSVKVTVLPNIKNIVLSVNQSNLFVGQTQPISVAIEPQKCFDTRYIWKTSDKSVAVVEIQSDGNTIIRATGIGSCVLTCAAKEGECSATCTVNVDSTFKKHEHEHDMLSLTAIFAVVSIFAAVLGGWVFATPVAVATWVCGVLAISKNKHDKFWAILLMILAIIFTVLSATGTVYII